eukprot:CAMPEP_0115480320 /NCGR_PEP_ID=MMETSP0271-20121206/57205_1 /TAXON_ID=71861 /ORGANISM="Scrippsiella trochoidea, Strain CCMP3099" /LENGTH=36 /DNA_ID= /DNA_START= /DNA_END= /DNA_ORIENTATION=
MTIVIKCREPIISLLGRCVSAAENVEPKESQRSDRF